MEKLSLFSWPPTYVFSMLNPFTSWISGMGTHHTLPFPKTETHETENAYVYTADVPGIHPDQIALTFQHGSILLRIEQSEDRRENGRHYRQSRSVRRSFTLPVYTDAAHISAQLKDGVLTVTIPKADKPVAPASHAIPINR
jgi:HSP20 family protein